jgi:hypothetical protein
MRTINLFILGLVSMLLVACVTKPIQQTNDYPFPPGSETLSLQQIESVISAAAVKREWTVMRQKEGQLIATYSPRTHMAKVAIDYNKKTFSITYLDSVNLDYTGTSIHPNYNRWVANLQKDIVNAVAAAVIAER